MKLLLDENLSRRLVPFLVTLISNKSLEVKRSQFLDIQNTE
jgi:predicted nuclease of predicted toxin-antitoxin system